MQSENSHGLELGVGSGEGDGDGELDSEVSGMGFRICEADSCPQDTTVTIKIIDKINLILGRQAQGAELSGATLSRHCPSSNAPGSVSS